MPYWEQVGVNLHLGPKSGEMIHWYTLIKNINGQLRICFSFSIVPLNKSIDGTSYFRVYQVIWWQLFPNIQEEQGHFCIVLLQVIVQVVLLQSPGFAHEPLYSVSIYSFFKVPAAYTHTSLQYSCLVYWQPDNFYREIGKTFTGFKQLVYGFPAFKFVLLF